MKTQTFVLSLGLLWLCGAQTVMAESRNTTSPAAEDAATRFQQAVDLYREGSYEGALAEFRKAYQISPSYRVLYNIAQTQYALHDFVGASASLRQYVSEGGGDIPADRRVQVDEMSAKLEERIAHLQISANLSGADLRIDDTSVGVSPLPGPIAVNVGTHKVSAFKAGSPEAVRMITVAGKESMKVDLKLEELVVAHDQAGVVSPVPTFPGQPSSQTLSIAKTPPSGTPGRTGLIVSLSTTAVLAAGTGISGYLALAAQKDLKDQIDTYPNTKAKIDDARSRSKRYGYMTDALGAATLLSGGVALYLAITHRSDSPKAKSGKVAEPIALVPTVGGMVVAGSF